MTDRTDKFIFAGFWMRVLAAVIDTIIAFAFLPITIPLMNWTLSNQNIALSILWSIGWTIAWLWVVVRFGGTPGKLIIGIRIVDVSGKFLSWKRAILRILLPEIILTINHELQLWKVYSTYPGSIPDYSFMEFGAYMDKYGEPFVMIGFILAFFIYLDIGVILFNTKKRAIHDFIAGSYVITKKSYFKLDEPNNEVSG